MLVRSNAPDPVQFYLKLSHDDWTIRAVATYQHEPFSGLDDCADLGLSARHNDKGLNLTIGLSRASREDGEDASGLIIKGGWLASLNSLGYTAFSIDHSVMNDAILEGDKAESIGFIALQKWDSIGLDLYAGYRKYDVTRPDIDLKPLNFLALGAIYTF